MEERNHETKVHKLKEMFVPADYDEDEETLIRFIKSWTSLSEEIWQDIEQSPPPRDPGHKNKDEKKKYEEEMQEYNDYEKKINLGNCESLQV